MALKKAKPTSPGRRFVVQVVNPDLLYKGRPYGPLTAAKSRIDGRNNAGRITVRHRGGGHKKLYRVIDFKRTKDGIPAKVERIEYDPNRSAYIALILYKDGERRYIVAPKGLKAGAEVCSGPESPISLGNCLPLQNIPLGSVIHCIELKPGKGAQMIRSAGSSAQLVAKEGSYAIIKMRSGEMRKVLLTCRAVIGQVSNPENNLRSLGKAGAKRWKGVRPSVRGAAMNPCDHPHGGGEGKAPVGLSGPKSKWGKPTLGYKTRKRKSSRNFL